MLYGIRGIYFKNKSAIFNSDALAVTPFNLVKSACVTPLFSILSIEINLSIVAAVLTIVGYSMNDTVVIYDRIRENLSKFNKLEIDQVSNLSVNETLSRTLITSVTTLLALFSIFILGGEILKGFSFAMILGVIIGTYSSIFVASPVLRYLKVSSKTLEKKEDKIVP